MSIFQYFQINPSFFLVVIFILGLIIGSFLNVVIFRLPQILYREWKQQCSELLECTTSPDTQNSERYNLIVPRSRCPNCKITIRALDNIPVLSFILLGGKCRNCQQSISYRYPAIEIFTAVISVMVAWRFGLSPQVVFALILTWALICLSVIDFDHQLLPDDISLPLLWLGILCNYFGLFTDIYSSVLGAIIGYLLFWFIFKGFKMLTGKVGMGYGDFKLLAMLGAWMGWQSLLLIILIASLAGSIIGIILILTKRQDGSKPIPFGPYLAIAGWISLIWGNEITTTYINLAIR